MVEYNKVYKKKDGRLLVASGPRASQNRQKQQGINPPVMNVPEIDSLRRDIKKLTSAIPTNVSGYTKDQVDTMINTAIEDASVDLERKYIFEITELKTDNAKLNSVVDKLNIKLDKKDDIILELTTNSRPINMEFTDPDSDVVSDRPSMENIFIDPTKKSEEVLESHITNKETESNTSKVKSSVDKLKKLMNK